MNNLVMQTNFKFDGNHFKMWYKIIINILTGQGLAGYVTTDIINLNNNPNLANEIRKNNAKATTLIMNSISPKIFQDIEDLDSAFEMMEKLKLLYDVDQNILTDQ